MTASKRMIQGLSGILLVAGPAFFLWMRWYPPTLREPRVAVLPESRPLQQPASNAPDGADLGKAWARVFARRYRRPLYDPPPKKKAPVAIRAPAPPPWRLLATMPEPQGGSALFQDASGATAVVAQGQEIVLAGAKGTLVTVQADRVEVSYKGRSFTLKMKNASGP